MGLGPVPAVRKLSNGTLKLEQVDDRVTEAFASQVLHAIATEVRSRALNPNGGGIAFGHPTGCSGARILVGLVSSDRTGGRYGIATLCVSGGQGMAVLVERVWD
jgi:acetyl-CoA acetyltransferase